MINTYIVSGFLGAGKTSFIKHLLNMNFGKVMLLENEFGEVGVDASFFDKSLAIKEVNNGCICCSLKGDFKQALSEIETYDIDTLIIEPSGVGKLSDIMAVLVGNPNFRLLSHVCIVNVETCKKYHLNYKEYFDDQVIACNAVILSHLDVASEDKVSQAREIIQSLNDEVEISNRPIDQYSNEELLDLIVKNVYICPECLEEHHHGEDCGCHHHHHEHDEHECCHHHDHDHHDHEHHHHHHEGEEDFESIAFKSEHIFTYEELESIFKNVDEDVLRIKGYVKGENTMWYFNYILKEYHIFEGPIHDEALIVVIGSHLDKQRYKELFNE